MYNFIDGDFFESLSDYSFGDMYSNNMTQPSYEILKSVFDKFESPIFFIETHRIGYLLNEIRRFPNQKCRIIAHNSDATFGQEILQYIPNNVEKLWCQNYNYIETDVVKSLPIGLERKRWFPEQKKQDVIINNINIQSDRIKKAYMNFDMGTNYIRNNWFNYLNNKNFIEQEMVGNGKDYKKYISNLLLYEFVVSPPGNGIDCHRNWESLYLGTTPIIEKSNFTNQMFSDMPVLLVDSYTDISEELLFNYKKSGSLDKLKPDYWLDKIKNDVKYVK
jgi:hypothetical protein